MSQPENYDDDYADDIDEFEEAAMDCRQTSDGGCELAGTEWCDWSCPFSDELYRRKNERKARHRRQKASGDLLGDDMP